MIGPNWSDYAKSVQVGPGRVGSDGVRLGLVSTGLYVSNSQQSSWVQNFYRYISLLNMIGFRLIIFKLLVFVLLK